MHYPSDEERESLRRRQQRSRSPSPEYSRLCAASAAFALCLSFAPGSTVLAEQRIVVQADTLEHDVDDALSSREGARPEGLLSTAHGPPTVDRRRIARGTQIKGSLSQSLAAIGLGGDLVQTIQQALAPKIALGSAARSGDALRVIVDAEYSGDRFVRFGKLYAVEYASQRAGRFEAYWFEPEPGRGDLYDENGRSLRGKWLRTPVRYDRISSGYSLKRRHPVLKRVVPHLGVDYSAGRGTPVWAAADGLVTFAGRLGANGNLVSIRHSSGYESHYAHLAKIGPGIHPGCKLKQKQLLGFVGSTGRSTGPHLHFALKRDGRFVDPAQQLDRPGAPVPRAVEARFHATLKRLRAELSKIPLPGQPPQVAKTKSR